MLRGEGGVSSCCSPRGHEAIFDARFARSVAGRYRRRGLTPAERQIVGFSPLVACRVRLCWKSAAASVRSRSNCSRWATTHVTNVELVDSYEPEAARLPHAQGLTGRARPSRAMH